LPEANFVSELLADLGGIEAGGTKRALSLSACQRDKHMLHAQVKMPQPPRFVSGGIQQSTTLSPVCQCCFVIAHDRWSPQGRGV
jgi:hypothetical protein